jgi:hypothetical protein
VGCCTTKCGGVPPSGKVLALHQGLHKAEAYNHYLPALPRYKGTAPDKRAPGLQSAPYNDGGVKEGSQGFREDVGTVGSLAAQRDRYSMYMYSEVTE